MFDLLIIFSIFSVVALSTLHSFERRYSVIVEHKTLVSMLVTV